MEEWWTESCKLLLFLVPSGWLIFSPVELRKARHWWSPFLLWTEQNLYGERILWNLSAFVRFCHGFLLFRAFYQDLRDGNRHQKLLHLYLVYGDICWPSLVVPVLASVIVSLLSSMSALSFRMYSRADDICLFSFRMKALLFTLVRAFEFELAVPPEDIAKKTTIVQRPLVISDPEGGNQMPLLLKPVVQQ